MVAKLPNGLTLLLLEDHKLPTVTFTMWIRPGQLADPSDLPGLASFTADMLREGTERRSSLAIAAEADSLGATLGANARFGASYTMVNAAGLADTRAANSRSAERYRLASGVLAGRARQLQAARNGRSRAAPRQSSVSRPANISASPLWRRAFGDSFADTRFDRPGHSGGSEALPRPALPPRKHDSRRHRRLQNRRHACADREIFCRLVWSRRAAAFR